MQIVITGGSGFIGSQLAARLLCDGHSVSIFDKVVSPAFTNLTWPGDVRDAKTATRAMRGVEAVFHLAAEHRDDVTPLSLYDDVNVLGTRNVLQAAAENGCRRLIFASSVAVYPLNARSPDESSPIAPFNHYGQSKAEAERLVCQWARADSSRSAIVVRPCVVFGEGNRGNVYNLLRQVSTGRFVMMGRGTNRKSMAYVGNVVEFLASRLPSSPGFQIFNYADKPDLSTREIVAIARHQLGCAEGLLSKFSLPYPIALGLGYVADFAAWAFRRKLPVSSIRVRKFCAETTVSADRVKALGFTRPFSLEEGLRRTIAHEFGDSTRRA